MCFEVFWFLKSIKLVVGFYNVVIMFPRGSVFVPLEGNDYKFYINNTYYT